MSVETSTAETDSTSADFMASVSSSEEQNRVSGFAISDEVVLETKDVKRLLRQSPCIARHLASVP